MSARDRSTLITAVALMLVGAAMLLYNFDLLPPGLYNLWPIPVIAVGLGLLARAATRQGRGMVGAVLVLTLGVFWLLENYEKATDRMFVPVVLIALGTGLLLRYFFQGRAR
jgi:hypothetical protein